MLGRVKDCIYAGWGVEILSIVGGVWRFYLCWVGRFYLCWVGRLYLYLVAWGDCWNDLAENTFATICGTLTTSLFTCATRYFCLGADGY